MKITKQLEAEILQVMDDYWNSYLNGDLQTWASYLMDNYRNIGTTKTEIWNSKKEIVDFTNKVLDQTVGMADMKNKKTQIIKLDPYIMVHELGDTYIKVAQDWIFYADFRVSTLLEKTNVGWKILHQHGSYPDSKTEDGEAFGFDEIKVENKKLRDAIQSRTIELEHKNRELEIEAALERVRSRTMAMQKSEELKEVVTSLFVGLDSLGFDTQVCNIALIDRDTKCNHMWSAHQIEEGLSSYFVFMPNIPHPFYQGIVDAFLVGKPFSVFELSKETQESYFPLFFEMVDFSSVPEGVRTANNNLPQNVETIFLSSAAMKYGMLTISRNEPLEESEAEILKRFAKVFEQTYTRFLDLQKAEAQAREAQIEATLERVRASGMAMHHTSDLQQVVNTVSQQFASLIIENSGGVFISILDDIEDEIVTWGAGRTADYVQKVTVPKFDRPINTDMIKKVKKGSGFFIEEFSNAEKVEFLKHLFKYPPYNKTSKEHQKNVLAKEGGYTRSVTVNQYTAMFMINHDGRIFSESENEILIRFGKVFEQNYVRFLDLKKAEEQAKEAQIEAALESVRTQTMTIRESYELRNIVSVMYDKMELLGLAKWGCAIMICHEETTEFEFWLTEETASSNSGNYFVKGKEHPVYRNIWMHWKKQSSPFSLHHQDEYKLEFDKYWLSQTDFKHLPDEVKASVFSRNEVFLNYAPMKHGLLNAISYKPLSDELMEVLARFAKVFEQTYTRFLDIQKAEAQAREAQIEAALERVRSASMAMHKTEELANVVTILFNQFRVLEVDILIAYMGIYHIEEKYVHQWFSPIEGIREESFFLRLPTEPWEDTTIKDWKAGKEMAFVSIHGKEAVIQYCKEIDTIANWNFFEDMQKKLSIEKIEQTEANHKYGNLSIVQQRKATLEEIVILKRFGKVFEQTYTRFLDLQKAEAQAREAQIEVALERVRSRALAMRHSDELSEAAELLYEEFFKLGVESFSCGYLINDDENEVWKIWLTNPGEKFFKEFWTAPYYGDEVLKERHESWKREEKFHCAVLEGEINRKHNEYIATLAPWKEEMLDSLPHQLVFNSAHFSVGHLLVISGNRLNEEIENAMERFANVFDLTYQRFLDLQKTEEQNKQLEIVFQENQRLLHSILPMPIAEQIRKGDKNVVQRFDKVSILFADIVGFTILSDKIQPQEVVDILNGLFSKFDDLTDKYGIEKIKTIGDAYMVASGVPEQKDDHAQVIFLFAKEMLQILEQFNQAENKNLKLRIGISSGPVVAGVIGKKRFAYDLWGDTVNTAARMEAYGQESRIQISPTTHEILKADFEFEKIPNLEIKGKGTMDVYLWSPFSILK